VYGVTTMVAFALLITPVVVHGADGVVVAAVPIVKVYSSPHVLPVPDWLGVDLASL